MLIESLTNIVLAGSEIEQTGLFPFPFNMHLVFCLISLVFFAWRFSKDKQPYQLIFAFAIPFSMILRFFETDKPKFQIVGLIEGIFILAAFISTFVCKKKPAAENAESSADAKTGNETAAPAENASVSEEAAPADDSSEEGQEESE